jgi:acyl-CoA thioester hydrolase
MQQQEMQETLVRHRVCYADTDAGGVVYHSRYIELAEHARNRLMYHVGFSFASLLKEHQVQLMVHKVEAVYHAPALLEDELGLRATIRECRPSRSVWRTEVHRHDVGGPQRELVAVIHIEMVAWDASSRRLTRHPDALLQALAPHVVAPPAQFPVNARSMT